MADKDPDARPSIEPKENGPFLVRGLETFSNSRGDPIPTKRVMALCRCGQSGNKPFCDGTHAKVGFKSAKLEGRVPDQRDDYVGKQITIHDNRGICSHAGFCTDCLASVWRMRTEPWIDPDGASVEHIVETIKKCPSGALSYSIDGVEYRDQDREPEVQVSKDGPYRVRGFVELKNTERLEGTSEEHYALCRCGCSKNKPFCDGTHWYVKFADDERGTMAGADVATTQSKWYRVADVDELQDGQVKAVTAGARVVALTRADGKYGALDGKCPHQGGPLGEGAIEQGTLRCPWHGWDFDPLTGASADESHQGVDTFDVEVRDDGVYVAIDEPVSQRRTVSDLMAETMVNWGVEHVFGMVGHSNLGLADAIRVQEQKGKLTYFGIRHEGAAAFACSAYAKLSGKPAACLTIAGPGATNLLTGLWDAHVDRAPVLALTGQVNTQVLGPGAFQEIDQASAFEAVSTWSQTVLHTSSHAELMSLALKHALVERGVAHLIFPDEVQVLPAPDDAKPSGPDGRLGNPGITPAQDSLDRVLELVGDAKRPTIIAGYGARTAMDEVTALADALNAPVLTTFKGKGQIPDDHPLAAGVLGRSGTPIASWFMNEADLLLVFGASFSHHTGIDEHKPIVQVDLDQMTLGKFHPVTVPVWGEIAITASLLRGHLPAQLQAVDSRPDVAERWALWRAEKERRMAKDRGEGLNSAIIFAALTRQAPENAVIAVDVGNNTYSFGRYFECKRQSVLMSGYLGSIGFALPAAIGAWAAYDMNITHILLNNSELGKISKEQRDGEWPVWQTSLHNPNFAEFANLCGGYGARVTNAEQLDEAMAAAIAYEGPALVEIMADPELI
jgi:thiamine pyrophosphate-dependent acetolactate synthase large subunit-like protein/CDGSH-type Zn-finger protein